MCVCGWFVEWRAGQGAGRKVRDSADQAKPTEETKLSEDPDVDDTDTDVDTNTYADASSNCSDGIAHTAAPR